MKLLVNLIPIKKGGGQQVAYNFILQVVQLKEIRTTFIVTKDTYIHKKLIELGVKNIIAINNSLASRLLFQLFGLKAVIQKNKINIIYTIFGPGLSSNVARSVAGCAYSNIFFPEIDFWGRESWTNKLKFRLIDKYRLASTLKCDAIIFENEAMMRRAVSLFKYPANRVKLILPSISAYPVVKTSPEFDARLNSINETDFNILMLTGWHKNKNIGMVPVILNELKMKQITDVRFIITISSHDSNLANFKKLANEYGVEDQILFFDSVYPHEVPLLFAKIDAVILLSLLESFSNNIIESWYFKKPLFISNEEWSKAICKEAAIYVDRDNGIDISDAITLYRNDVELQKRINTNAELILKSYPNPKEKVDAQINYLKEISYA